MKLLIIITQSKMCKIIAIPSQPEKFFIVPLFLCVPAKRFLSLLEDSESHSRTGMLHYKKQYSQQSNSTVMLNTFFWHRSACFMALDVAWIKEKNRDHVLSLLTPKSFESRSQQTARKLYKWSTPASEVLSRMSDLCVCQSILVNREYKTWGDKIKMTGW